MPINKTLFSETGGIEPDLRRFNHGFVVRPVRRVLPDENTLEVCEPWEADFWTVYGVIDSEHDVRELAVTDVTTPVIGWRVIFELDDCQTHQQQDWSRLTDQCPDD